MEWGKRFSELEECCSDSDLVKKWARDVSQRLPQTLSEYSSIWGKNTVKYPSNVPRVAAALCKLAEEKSGDRELQASLMCVALFFACDTEIRTGFPSDCVIWRLVFSAIEEKNGNAKLEAAALSTPFGPKGRPQTPSLGRGTARCRAASPTQTRHGSSDTARVRRSATENTGFRSRSTASDAQNASETARLRRFLTTSNRLFFLGSLRFSVWHRDEKNNSAPPF